MNLFTQMLVYVTGRNILLVTLSLQLLQGVPYTMMGPGGTPMHALAPGLGMHPMQSMPGMFPTPPMAFPAMPMATPYGFMSSGQEGMPMHLGAVPAVYGGYPPQQMQFQMPAMSIEQQMHQQQQQQSQIAGNHNARVRPGNSFNRRNSNSQQSVRSQAGIRYAAVLLVSCRLLHCANLNQVCCMQDVSSGCCKHQTLVILCILGTVCQLSYMHRSGLQQHLRSCVFCLAAQWVQQQCLKHRQQQFSSKNLCQLAMQMMLNQQVSQKCQSCPPTTPNDVLHAK